MSFELLSRGGGAGERSRESYLQRLRERAVARLREDEQALDAGRMAAELVSRRQSLRWLGMAAAGAALVRAERAVAAAPVSGRSCAPQYGAPSWPAPYEPSAVMSPVPMPGKATTSRTELANPKLWLHVGVQLSAKKGGWSPVEARMGYYSDPWGGGVHALTALADAGAGMAYIVRGNETFYAAVDGEMLSCRVGPGVLTLHGSFFKTKGGVEDAIAGFTQVSDPQAYRLDQQETKINLEKGLPQEFWVRNGYNGWQQNSLGIAKAQRTGDVLELTLRSEGYPAEATFTLDLKAQTLMKTKFEGKEWTP